MNGFYIQTRAVLDITAEHIEIILFVRDRSFSNQSGPILDVRVVNLGLYQLGLILQRFQNFNRTLVRTPIQREFHRFLAR